MRSPLWKLNRIDALSKSELLSLLDDQFFLEALWLASPILHNQAMKWKNGRLNEKQQHKVIISLAKYYERLCSRTVPFGLFAGITSLPLINSGKITFSNEKPYSRFTRIDATCLYSIIKNIENNPEIRPKLNYTCNSSLYLDNHNYKFAQYVENNHKRSYLILTIENEENINTVVEQCRREHVSYSRIKNALLLINTDEKEVDDFINELIDCQFLTSNIQPSLLDTDPLQTLIQKLATINTNVCLSITERLHDLRESITRLDNKSCNEVDDYKSILGKIAEITGDEINESSRVFQVDIYRNTQPGSGLALEHVNELYSALNICLMLSKQRNNLPGLKNYAEKFRERYGDSELPLTLLMDPDIGLGFPLNQSNRVNTPLIDDFNIEIPGKNTTLTVSDIDYILFNTLINAQLNDEQTIDIEEKLGSYFDFTSEPPEELSLRFQPTPKITFSKVFLDNKEYLILNSLSGNSANDVLGRFGHVNQQIAETIKDIAEHERKIYNEYVLADIVHLQEPRLANVTTRPKQHKYQIPYLGEKNVDDDYVISIDDLYVSVDNHSNVIKLRSKRLNKFVIPRLGNAHNFTQSSLPIYYFLCSMQNQSPINGLVFDWGVYSKFVDSFPRVIYKNVILSPAKWVIKNKHIKSLGLILQSNTPENDVLTNVNVWRLALKIPEIVILAASDRDLYVNFKNYLSILAFYDEIKERLSIELKEFLYDLNDTRNTYANEFQLPLLRKLPEIKQQNNISYKSDTPHKYFFPGSTVLYYKIYGGEIVCEQTLVKYIYPTITLLKKKGVIGKWFFIRYRDPEFHLRIRIFLNSGSSISEINSAFETALKCNFEQKVIWKVQIDSYERELNRYGYSTIDDVESMFYCDSESCTKAINCIHTFDDPELYRWLYALLIIDNILNIAGLNTVNKYEFINPIRASFFSEFGGTKELSDILGKKYRIDSEIIQEAFGYRAHSKINYAYIGILQDIINKYIGNISPMMNIVKQKSNVKEFRKILESIVHMTINRIILSNPRKHELVIYEYLDRFYRSISHRSNLKNEKI